MASTMTDTDCIGEIGTTAGDVWQVLRRHGPMTLARLSREIDMPRDVVMQSVGWLAREGKVDLLNSSRGKMIALK